MTTTLAPQHAAPSGIAATAATCPFCGLLCDDLSVENRAGTIRILKNGCALSRDGYARADDLGATPRIAGREASLAEAITAAAAILRAAVQPLFGGLATDVAGARAAVALADRCGAVVDHVNSGAKFRNLLAYQDRGWITSTLAEARNRADLIVVIGPGATRRYPRLFERLVREGESLFGPGPALRRLIQIGSDAPPAAGVPAPWQVDVAAEHWPDLLAALSALVAGRRLDCTAVAGIGVDTLRAVAAALREARYGIVTWAAPDLDFPHAELTVQAVTRLLATLNRTTRFAALPLGGTDGDFTADAVLLWQTGFPFRTSFATGVPNYDPLLYDGRRMLERGEVDALLWVSTLGVHPPPRAGVPTIVLAAPWERAASACDVFIPVGTPGIDHAGHLLRSDKVVTLRLAAVRPSPLPRAADVLAALAAEI